MTDKDSKLVAQARAKGIVQQLRAGNERATREEGAPVVAEKRYRGLESTLTRKLLKRAS